MCEWCERLITRNYKWDHHAEWRGMRFLFKYTQKSKWHKEWYSRKYWHRAGKWVDTLNLKREYRGTGSRYYWRI
jgi:hypothetical protein